MTDVEIVGSGLAVEERVSRAGGDKDSKGRTEREAVVEVLERKRR